MKVPQTDYRAPLAGPAGIRKQPVTLASQSVAQFGETLARIGLDLAEKQKRARDISQFSSAKVGIISDFNDFRIELAKDMDYASHEHKANKKLKEVYNSRSKEITEPGVKDALRQWFDEKSIGLLFDVRTEAYRMGREYRQVKLGEELAFAEKTLDKELAEELLTGAQAAGTVFPDDAERERVRIGHSIDFSLTQREAYSRGLEGGLEYINSKEVPESITADDRTVISNMIRTDIERAERQAAEQLKKDQAALFNEGISEYIAGTLTMAKLNSPKYRLGLKNENRTQLVNMLESRPKEDGGKAESEIDDPSVVLEYTRLYDDPEKSKDELKQFLSEHLGEGISPKKYMELYKDLEIRRPDLARRSGDKVFEDMRNDGIIDKSKEQELLLYYHDVIDGQDLTDDQKIEKAKQIGELYKEEKSRGIIRGIFGVKGKEEEPEAEEVVDLESKIREGGLIGIEKPFESKIREVYDTQLEEYRKETGKEPVSVHYLETGEQVFFDGKYDWVYREGKWYRWSDKKQKWIRRRLK